MRYLGLLLLLSTVVASAQRPIPDEEQLKIDRMRALGLSPVNMIRIQAVHFSDGTPAKGVIACNGWWLKFDEKETGDWNWPFQDRFQGRHHHESLGRHV